MKRGPKKTPTKILQMRGSWRAGLRTDEPRLSAVRLGAPAWLAAEAKPTFESLADIVYGMGTSSSADVFALTLLAESITLYQKATADVVANGCAAATKTGGTKTSAWLTARVALFAEISRGFSWFGMTPSDRPNVTALPHAVPDDDALEAIAHNYMREFHEREKRGKRKYQKPA